MEFAFSDEQEMLRRSARDFLAKECGPNVVRRLMKLDDPDDPALRKRVAELGWTALGIPESYGGVGTFLDLVVVLEEAGRALLPGPFFSTMALAVPVLLEAAGEAQKKEVLTAIAAGDARATLALTEPSGRWDAPAIALRASQTGAAWKLDGVKTYVPDGAPTTSWSRRAHAARARTA
jgi:alkylation response protein AidB-like acyl-CoA dehydrogenase